jgi:hypothetical protein
MSGAILIGASRLTDCGHRAKGAAQHTHTGLSHTLHSKLLMLCCVLVLSERQIMKKHFHLGARKREFLSQLLAKRSKSIASKCVVPSELSIPITSAVTFLDLPLQKLSLMYFATLEYLWQVKKLLSVSIFSCKKLNALFRR